MRELSVIAWLVFMILECALRDTRYSGVIWVNVYWGPRSSGF